MACAAGLFVFGVMFIFYLALMRLFGWYGRGLSVAITVVFAVGALSVLRTFDS